MIELHGKRSKGAVGMEVVKVNRKLWYWTFNVISATMKHL